VGPSILINWSNAEVSCSSIVVVALAMTLSSSDRGRGGVSGRRRLLRRHNGFCPVGVHQNYGVLVALRTPLAHLRRPLVGAAMGAAPQHVAVEPLRLALRN
jgi:hypothetical protein